MWLFKQEQRGQVDADLAVIINNIAVACKNISNLVATAPVRGLVGLAESKNKSGDEQKKLDVISNDIFVAAMADTARSAVIVTEEEDVPVGVDALSGDYIVCFDPIDGSSNIDAAVPTGSIWGVYSPGECVVDPDDDAEAALEKCVLNTRKSGEELVCAGYVMYSSATVMMLTVGDGVYGFTLDWSTGEFVLSHEDVKIPETTERAGRFYSGNQGNVDKWAPEMRAYVEHLQGGGGDGGGPFTYRYIGALVGDFHRTLLYGGIWLYPPDASAPEGKARLLYEVAPMGYMAEQAGGAATWGPLANERVVEVVPQHIHQRSPMFVGSKSMVEGLAEFLAKEHAK
jgi:fructose-1,6-bisphosphatase I